MRIIILIALKGNVFNYIERHRERETGREENFQQAKHMSALFLKWNSSDDDDRNEEKDDDKP